MFSILDWSVVGLYFVAMAWIGFHFSKSNKNFKDFMFASGGMHWLPIGISLIATSVSATTFLGYPADGYANDMRLMMLNIAPLAAIVIITFVFIPRFRNSGVQSAYELLEGKFSRPVRVMAATLYTFHLLLRTGILLYGPVIVVQKITGLAPWLCIVLMAAISILYTYFGGIKAVTWTDVIQFLVFFGGGIVCIWVTASAIGGWNEAWSLASEAGKTRWLDFTWDPSSDRNFWSAAVAYIVLEVALRGCDQQFVQRYQSCRSVKDANLSSISSVFFGVAIGFIFFTAGIFIFVYYKISMIQMLPEMKVDQVFPHFILTVLPDGFKGLLVAALLAAAMSSLSSAYTALSNTTVVDFLGYKKEDKPDMDSHGVGQARKWVLLWGFIGMLVSFICVLWGKSLLVKALTFTSLFTGPLLAMFLLAFYRSRTRSAAVLASAVIGMLSLLPFLQNGVPWKPLYAFSWPWNPVISLTSTLISAIVIDMIMGLMGQKENTRADG